MKKLFRFSALFLLLLIVQGCLIFGSIEYRIRFNEKFSKGSIAILYHDISSTDSTIEKQRDDFDGLVEIINSDEFNLDHLDDGIYVKERRLYEENGKMNALIKGIFRELRDNDLQLKVEKEGIVMTFKKDDDSRLESNGIILETENSIIVTWPKTTDEIYFEVFPDNSEKAYSLIDYYREWNAKN